MFGTDAVTDDEESTVATTRSLLAVDRQSPVVTQPAASDIQQPGTSGSAEKSPRADDANGAAEPFAGVSPHEEDQPGERDSMHEVESLNSPRRELSCSKEGLSMPLLD